MTLAEEDTEHTQPAKGHKREDMCSGQKTALIEIFIFQPNMYYVVLLLYFASFINTYFLIKLCGFAGGYGEWIIKFPGLSLRFWDHVI